MKPTSTLQLFAIALFALCLYACGKRADDTKEIAEDQNEEKFEKSDIEKDAEFAVAAADGGMLEVQLGQLAASKGSSEAVKKFGQSMVDDHSKANDELKTLTAQKNITLPATLSDKNQKKYDEIAEKSGVDFDKAYASFMVDDHKEDIDEFKKEAEKGNDADLKTWAAGKVSVLEHHLSMAETMHNAVKDSSNK